MEAVVIGDVHGCLNELKELIDKAKTKNPNIKVFLVGDLIDRGDNSEGVIKFVRDNDIHCTLGNHELMAIEATNGSEINTATSDWACNGGYEVVTNYSSKDALLDDIAWMKTLPVAIDTGVETKYNKAVIVSHAYIGYVFSNYPVALTSKYVNEVLSLYSTMAYAKSLVWSRRQPKGENTSVFNIFGHTPTLALNPERHKEGQCQPIMYDNGANLDTGCVYKTDRAGLLTGIMIPSMEVIQVTRKLKKERNNANRT